MSLSKETDKRLQDTIKEMVSRYITATETAVTDFYIKVNSETGILTIEDDDSNQLTTIHIKEWEGADEKAVYEKELRSVLTRMQNSGDFDSLNIAKPYSFVLTDDDNQSIVDMLIVDDDTLILSEDLLEGFDEEMNDFLKHLLEE